MNKTAHTILMALASIATLYTMFLGVVKVDSIIDEKRCTLSGGTYTTVGPWTENYQCFRLTATEK